MDPGTMESQSRESRRRELRASVFRICLKRDPAETALNGLPETRIEEALVSAGLSADDEEARRWYEEDLADFSRAVLVSDLVARRMGEPSRRERPSRRARSAAPVGARAVGRKGTPSVADLLDGMLAQEKKG